MCSDSAECCEEGYKCLVNPKGATYLNGANSYNSLDPAVLPAYKKITSVDPCCKDDNVCGDDYCCADGYECCGGQCLYSGVCINGEICEDIQACGGAPKAGSPHTVCCPENYTCLVNDIKSGDIDYSSMNENEKPKHQEITAQNPCCYNDKVCGSKCCADGYSCVGNQCVRACILEPDEHTLPSNIDDPIYKNTPGLNTSNRGTVINNPKGIVCETGDICARLELEPDKFYRVCLKNETCDFEPQKYNNTGLEYKNRMLCKGRVDEKLYWKKGPGAPNQGYFLKITSDFSRGEDQKCDNLSCANYSTWIKGAMSVEDNDLQGTPQSNGNTCEIEAKCDNLEFKNSSIYKKDGSLAKIACKGKTGQPSTQTKITKQQYNKFKTDNTNCCYGPQCKLLESGLWCDNGTWDGIHCISPSANTVVTKEPFPTSSTDYKTMRLSKSGDTVNNFQYQSIPCTRSYCNNRGTASGNLPNCSCKCDKGGSGYPKSIGETCQVEIKHSEQSKMNGDNKWSNSIDNVNYCTIDSSDWVNCGTKKGSAHFFRFLKENNQSSFYLVNTNKKDKLCGYDRGYLRCNKDFHNNRHVSSAKLYSPKTDFGKANKGGNGYDFNFDGISGSLCANSNRVKQMSKNQIESAVSLLDPRRTCNWQFKP